MKGLSGLRKVENEGSEELSLLVDTKAVREMLDGISESSLRRLRMTGRFPQPIRLGGDHPRLLRWNRAAIVAWIEAEHVRAQGADSAGDA
jgi:predicted DNA-binding transcriptional regulator AlpA